MALDMLGVAEDDAEFVVLSEPKAGLFGRLRGEARVQARVQPVTPPPKRGRRQRPERARSGGAGRKPAAGDGARRERSGGGGGRGSVAVDERGDDGPSSLDSSGAGPGAGEDGETKVRSNGNGSNGGGGRNRNRRGPRNGGSATGSQPKDRGNQSSGRKPGESEESMEESLTLEQQGEAATEFLVGLVREFGLDAEVGYSEIDEETVQVAAVGDDLGLLVGPRGATLSAVQDLTRTFVQRQSENRTDRILVDVGGYREKRTAALRRFTAGIVDEVKATGEERALEPMSPADRKVVHDTVNEIEGIETRSAGTEPSRYVVIQPSS
jgi:spoIIIJ-associated protein